MKILVGVKRVVDYAVKIRVSADKKGVELVNVKMSVNPFCEIAVEEAIRLKEKKVATEIIALSIGPKACQETLRTALAMGADRGIHIETSMRTDQELQPLSVAKVFKHIAEKEKIDLIILGKQSIDSDNGQTGQMLAGLLNWSQCTFSSSLTFSDDKQSVVVTREADVGRESLRLSMPAVITTDLRLNEPRYATLPNIMKAKKKPLEVIAAESLQSIEFRPQNTVLVVEEPAVRQAGIVVDSVDQLIDGLRNKSKVI